MRMGLGYGRPLCCFCWIFVLCSAVALRGSRLWLCLLLGIGGALLALALIVVAMSLGKRGHRRGAATARYVAFLSCALLLAGALGGAHLFADTRRTEVYADTQQIIHATVLSREYSSTYATGYTVLTERIGEDAVRIKAYLQCEYVAPMQSGDRIVCHVAVSDLRVMQDMRGRLADGCRLQLLAQEAADVDPLGEVRASKQPLLALRVAASRLQSALSIRLQRVIDGEAGALCAALLLGDRASLDGETVLHFRRSGVSHLLALSGMHLGTVMAVVSMLLWRMRLPLWLRRWLVCLISVSYVLLTGCAVSTTRAAIMLLYLQLAAGRGRDGDGLTSLSLFFAACIAWEPYMLYDVSLWLSSLAAAVPVAVVPALREMRNRRRERPAKGHAVWRRLDEKLWMPLSISLLCMLILVVPMWLSFGEISLLSPLSTLLLTLPVTAILFLGVLWLGLAALGSATVAVFWQGALAAGMELLAQWVLDGTATLSALPGTLLSLRYASLTVLLPALAVLLVGALLLHLRRRYLALLLSLSMVLGVSCVALEQWRQRDTVTVDYAVSGDSELMLVSYGGDSVLCDFTDGSYRAYAALLDEGLPMGDTELDALLLTHYHGKHVSMLERLSAEIRVRKLYLPLSMEACEEEKALADEGVARKLYDLAAQRGIEVAFYEPMCKLPLSDGLALQGLQYTMLKRSAHPVLTLSLVCADGRAVTFAGAAFSEEETTRAFSADCIAASEVVLLGEHGPVCKQFYTVDAWSEALHTVVLRADGAGAYLDENEQTLQAFSRAACIPLRAEREPVVLRLTLPRLP